MTTIRATIGAEASAGIGADPAVEVAPAGRVGTVALAGHDAMIARVGRVVMIVRVGRVVMIVRVGRVVMIVRVGRVVMIVQVGRVVMIARAGRDATIVRVAPGARGDRIAADRGTSLEASGGRATATDRAAVAMPVHAVEMPAPAAATDGRSVTADEAMIVVRRAGMSRPGPVWPPRAMSRRFPRASTPVSCTAPYARNSVVSPRSSPRSSRRIWSWPVSSSTTIPSSPTRTPRRRGDARRDCRSSAKRRPRPLTPQDISTSR